MRLCSVTSLCSSSERWAKQAQRGESSHRQLELNQTAKTRQLGRLGALTHTVMAVRDPWSRGGQLRHHPRRKRAPSPDSQELPLATTSLHPCCKPYCTGLVRPHRGPTAHVNCNHEGHVLSSQPPYTHEACTSQEPNVRFPCEEQATGAVCSCICP